MEGKESEEKGLLKRAREDTRDLTAHIRECESRLSQLQRDLPIKRQALEILEKSSLELAAAVSKAQTAENAAQEAEKSFLEAAKTANSLLDSATSEACGICCDSNIYSPDVACTSLGCKCKATICTACFSKILTGILKTPFAVSQRSLSCPFCDTLIPALVLAQKDFMDSLSPERIELESRILNEQRIREDGEIAAQLVDAQLDHAARFYVLPDSQDEDEIDTEEENFLHEENLRIMSNAFSLPTLINISDSETDAEVH
jgi:hypothetical protein